MIMDAGRELVKRVELMKDDYSKIIIYEGVLDAIIVFLVISIILLFSKLNFGEFHVLLLFTAITGIFIYFKRLRTRSLNFLLFIEENFSELREKLRTAYDNAKEWKENHFVYRLIIDVQTSLDNLDFNLLVDMNKVLVRVFLILCLVALILYLFTPKYLEIEIPGYGKILHKKGIFGTLSGEDGVSMNSGFLSKINKACSNVLSSMGLGGKKGVVSEGKIGTYSERESIFGEKRLAPLEGEEVKVEIKRGEGSEIGGERIENEDFNLRKISNVQVGEAEPSRYFREEISFEYKEIAEKYFEKLAEVEEE
ncbi:MAG: hypothetical protein ACE5K4_10025 [Candidatus Hydrothermarchaeota archaeon]